MNDQFKIGDPVKLKSGGPTMTIQKLKVLSQPEGIFKCSWFDGVELKSGYFHKDSLQVVYEDSLKNSDS